MSEANPRATRWFLTLNNYAPEDIELIESNRFQDLCKYIIYGEEEAPSTGTKHIHLYCRLKTKMYKNTIKCMFPRGVIEVARGDEMQCYNYCSKGGKFKEFGQRLSKIDDWVTKIQKTKKMLDDLLKMSWEEFGNTWTIQALNRRSQLIQWKFDRTPILPPFEGELREKNVWIWGPAGTGKTVWARKQMDPKNTMFKLQNKWWEGYDDYSCRLVIIEDLDKNYAKALTTHLKVWADRHWFAGEVKGGAIKVNPCKFFLIVTSNHSIEECFENEEDQKAIKRRFKEIKIEDPNDIFLSTMLDKSILTT